MSEDRVTVVQCLACGHVAQLERGTDDLPLVHLTKRLVCSQCGARTMKAQRAKPTVAILQERPTTR